MQEIKTCHTEASGEEFDRVVIDAIQGDPRSAYQICRLALHPADARFMNNLCRLVPKCPALPRQQNGRVDRQLHRTTIALLPDGSTCSGVFCTPRPGQPRRCLEFFQAPTDSVPASK